MCHGRGPVTSSAIETASSVPGRAEHRTQAAKATSIANGDHCISASNEPPPSTPKPPLSA